MEQAEIVYPCEWEYRVVGNEAMAVRMAVEEILFGKEFNMEISNVSAKGRYTSFVITTVVASEEARVGLFQELSRHPAIKIVL